MSNGKTLKFLSYAVGETILVFIGILLALQVSNMNEQRKSNQYELKMLSEIKKSLEHDITYAEYLLENRIARLDSNTSRSIELLKESKVDIEKLNYYRTSGFKDKVFSQTLKGK